LFKLAPPRTQRQAVSVDCLVQLSIFRVKYSSF
jgi:hypothetical protein